MTGSTSRMSSLPASHCSSKKSCFRVLRMRQTSRGDHAKRRAWIRRIAERADGWNRPLFRRHRMVCNARTKTALVRRSGQLAAWSHANAIAASSAAFALLDSIATTASMWSIRLRSDIALHTSEWTLARMASLLADWGGGGAGKGRGGRSATGLWRRPRHTRWVGGLGAGGGSSCCTGWPLEVVLRRIIMMVFDFRFRVRFNKFKFNEFKFNECVTRTMVHDGTKVQYTIMIMHKQAVCASYIDLYLAAQTSLTPSLYDSITPSR